MHTDVIYQDVELQSGHQYALAVDPEMRGLVYVLSGIVTVQDKTVKKTESCFVENLDRLEIRTESDARFMLCFGVQHNQPIYQHGSFVD
jgi:redox-sensitive bicupin YhaK (pirin superfamily)